MATLRWRIASLLLWLTVFFNIERLDLNGRDTIDLAPGIYILGIVMTVAALVPALRRRAVWLIFLPSAVLYFAVLYFANKPIIGGLHTYVTIAGLTMMEVTVFLAYLVGQALEQFQQAVEDITFSDQGGRLKSLDEAQETVQIEMIGSRRQQNPLSLVLLQADEQAVDMAMHKMVQELQRGMMQRYLLVTAARILSKSLRRTDLIIEDRKPGRLVLVAPDTPQEKAGSLGERMVRLLRDRVGIDANYGVAAFPKQALTFEELLDVAEQNLAKTATTTEPANPSNAPVLELNDGETERRAAAAEVEQALTRG